MRSNQAQLIIRVHDGYTSRGEAPEYKKNADPRIDAYTRMAVPMRVELILQA